MLCNASRGNLLQSVRENMKGEWYLCIQLCNVDQTFTDILLYDLAIFCL